VRILQVIQDLRIGGAERVMLALVSGGRTAGHEVAVAAGTGPLAGELDCPLFDLPILKRRPTRVPLASWKLAHALRSFRPQVVHCHNPGMAMAAAVPTRRGRRPPSLVSVHGVPEEDYRAAARVLRRAGIPVVACGPGVAAALVEQGIRVRATVVNGISAAPEPADRASIMREWGLSPTLRMIVAVGRLIRQKNHSLAIRALAEVPGAALVIIGSGALHEDLRRLSEDLGLAGRVVLAGERPDARPVIGAVDALVMPSQSEGLPLAALEALAAGTPLVATSVRGLRELLVHEVNALLVPPDNPSALAAAIRRVLAERDLAAALTEAGRVTASHHTEREMIEEYLRLYTQLSAEGRA
jgi:glycosyltransferase involved in cell wall biosynthesis